MDCSTNVKKLVRIEADVTVIPDAKIGKVESMCMGEPCLEPCSSDPCTYMISQMMCVRFPLTFGATVAARPMGIECNGQCQRNRRQNNALLPLLLLILCITPFQNRSAHGMDKSQRHSTRYRKTATATRQSR